MMDTEAAFKELPYPGNLQWVEEKEPTRAFTTKPPHERRKHHGDEVDMNTSPQGRLCVTFMWIYHKICEEH